MSADALDLIGIRKPDPRERDLADIPTKKLERLLKVYEVRIKLAPQDQFAQMKGQLVASELGLRVAVREVRADLERLDGEKKAS